MVVLMHLIRFFLKNKKIEDFIPLLLKMTKKSTKLLNMLHLPSNDDEQNAPLIYFFLYFSKKISK